MQRLVICLSLAVSAAAQRPALRDYGRLPLVFEPNQGQTDREVRFLARTGSGTLFLTEREMVLGSVRMRLAGSRKPEAINGLEPTGGISNYFIGDDPSKWRTKIPNYGRVEYTSVYAGVDVVYYGNPQKLEYDLVVAPGADPRAIQVEYEGVESLRVDKDGDLVLKTANGELRQKRPIAYQEAATGRVAVAVAYRLKGRRVAFELARYNAGRRLVIDPVFFYSTYLGGSGNDYAYGIAVDGSGSAYVAGQTSSTDFPTTNPAQASINGFTDAFVTKINAAGSARVYSTYLGGSLDELGYGIAVDSSGAACVMGITYSSNFPTVNPLQVSFGGSIDAFVARINPAGSALVYSTYLGGSGSEFGRGIAVDGSGAAYATGYTNSTNFPTANPLQAINGGGGNYDAFVIRINPAGSAIYSTYLGGNGNDYGEGLAVDGSGNAYVTGSTTSTNFPTTNPLQASINGGGDAFVTKINTAGSARVYSTYVGGSGVDQGYGIAVDASGAAYVTGQTNSTNFPTTNPLQASNGGGNDVFVTKINPTGSAQVYSTYLGGAGGDQGSGIAVDGAGNTYVAGFTTSTNFPTTNALQASYGGSTDAFVAKINSVGSARVYSTYLGGSIADQGNAIAVDGSGNAYVTGYTLSANFPTTSPLQATPGGGADAFVLSISGNSAVAAFRDTSGAIELTSQLSTSLVHSGGSFASDPSAAQNANGDTFIVARDQSNAVWLNVYDARTRTWDGWTSAGASVQGVPAVAAKGNTAYIVARDSSSAYWTNTFTRGAGFSGWVNRGGAFATDPAIGSSQLSFGNLYVVGKDNFNAIWTATWLVPTFGAWQLQGAVTVGKPSVTAGTDNAAYIAIRDASDSIWMGYQTGSTFNGWQPGGGSFPTDPQIAAAGGKVYVGALAGTGVVWYNTFNQGAGNNWVGWVNTGGLLSTIAVAASTGPQLFMAGLDASNQLWWYENPGAGWRFVYPGTLAVGLMSAAPR